MFSVGSVGIVDPGDAGKVVCAGPVVQLGVGIGGLEPSVGEAGAAVAARVSVLQTVATIRYPVPAEEPALSSVLGLIALQLRYRSGDGRVIATVMEVAVPPGGAGDPGTVSERPLLQFDSAAHAASVFFQTANAHLPQDSPLYDYRLAFGPNVYYVTLTLTKPAIVVGQPPAVAAIELIGLEPPAGGNGGNGNGGGGGNGGYDGGNGGGSGGGDGGPDDGPGHEPD